MADKDCKVKTTLKWPITQKIVNRFKHGSKNPKSEIFQVRKNGSGKKFLFQLELCHMAGVNYHNRAPMHAHCNLHLVKGDNVIVIWVIQNTFLSYMEFPMKSGESKCYNQYVKVSPGSELVCDLEVTFADIHEKQDHMTKSLKDDLSKLLQLGDLSDVTLICNDKEFKCHRSVLGARSTVFRTMLDPEKGFKEGKANTISIKNTDPAAFECFLSILYGGNFDINDMELTLDLLELAERYDMPTLKQVCSESLIDGLSSSNYWQCLSRCALLNVPDLVKEILRKAVDDPKDLRHNKRWLELIKTCPELTVTLLDVVEEKLAK